MRQGLEERERKNGFTGQTYWVLSIVFPCNANQVTLNYIFHMWSEMECFSFSGHMI